MKRIIPVSTWRVSRPTAAITAARRIFACGQVAGVLLAMLWISLGLPANGADPGRTQIARWKDGKTAAFLLMFDDSWPSHWQVAAPELAKRGMIGTFYICPAKGEHVKFAAQWEQELWKQGMIYGVHTMTHKGVKDLENAEWEIGECANVIRRIVPGMPGKLVSYAQPGVPAEAWNITPDERAALLKKHLLIERPDLKGRMTVYHVKTVEEMLALADKAIAGQGVEFLVIHGVERKTPDWGYQDFWALKQDVFLPLLDALQQRRDEGKLWITDHISAHQYETERDSAAVRTLEATAERISLELTAKADPKLYDHPLTLISQVPEAWKHCRVSQGSRQSEHPVANGAVQFDAVPNQGPVVIDPLKK